MKHETFKKLTFNKLGLALLVAMMAGGLVACQDDPGPAEEAGQRIDDAVEGAGESIEELGESIQDAAEGD